MLVLAFMTLVLLKSAIVRARPFALLSLFSPSLSLFSRIVDSQHEISSISWLENQDVSPAFEMSRPIILGTSLLFSTRLQNRFAEEEKGQWPSATYLAEDKIRNILSCGSLRTMSKIVKKVVKRNPLNALKRKRASDSIEAVQATRRVTAENILGIVEHLKRKDPTLRNVIEVLGPPLSLVSRIKGDAFTSLVKSIVGQQLSSKAAASIFCRVQDQCGGQGAHVVPEKILGAGTEKLRTLGLSGRKVEYVQDLASKFLSGELSNEKLASLSRDEVMEALIKVRGLGEWSVHMFQIFHLGEPGKFKSFLLASSLPPD